jgi:hypothetical protein
VTVRRPLVISGSSHQLLAAADSLDVVQACDGTATLIAGTTLAALAGLTFALEAGRVYVVEFALNLTQTTAATIGVAMAYSGTASAYSGILTQTAGNGGANSALATAISFSVALNATVGARFMGRIRATTAGNLTLQASRSVGIGTINASWGRLTRV